MQNKQGLKKELWTRIFRAGEEHHGEVRLCHILDDLAACLGSSAEVPSTLYTNAPTSGTYSSHKGTWSGLYFDPAAYTEQHPSQSLEEMELAESEVVEHARLITELRE